MSGLNEYSYILISASYIGMLQCVVLIEVFKAKLATYRHVDGKGKSILIVFRIIVAILFFILHQNDEWHFLNVCSDGIWETILMKFIYSVMLKSIGLSCTLEYIFEKSCIVL